MNISETINSFNYEHKHKKARNEKFSKEELWAYLNTLACLTDIYKAENPLDDELGYLQDPTIERLDKAKEKAWNLL